MTIVPVTENNLMDAAFVHAEAWRTSHRNICSPDFVAAHTTQRQAAYLQSELAKGKMLWLLCDPQPTGLVSVWNDVIENLYVLPALQRRGYGTRLLRFAMTQCSVPTLWVLNSNEIALQLYLKEGFIPSGRRKILNERLFEQELVYHPTGGQ